MNYLGIDVSKRTLDCTLLMNSHKKYIQVKNSTEGLNELLEWIQVNDIQELHACMEATGIYHELAAYFLVAHDFYVSIVNPFQIKSYAAALLSRHKTDKVDSRIIAQFCAQQIPKIWSAPQQSTVELKALVVRLEQLKGIYFQENNRLETTCNNVRTSSTRLIGHLREQIQSIEQDIATLIKTTPSLARQKMLLTSIDGIGEVTSALFLAYCADIEQFRTINQLVAFLGLNPRKHQSGTLSKKENISKQGSCRLRKGLYMPAMTALYRTQWGQAFHHRLANAGKPSKVIIVAMMRKLVHMMYGVLKSGKPFDPLMQL